MDFTQDFYDDLADNYHLIFGDREGWKRQVHQQGEVLDKLIRAEMETTPLSVLDCSCGIGTQAIGLALHGHEVHATDLSPGSVERASREAREFGVQITFGIADFRALDAQVAGTFDVVISCDNALPHLLSGEDLLLAARSIRSRLREDGLFLASIRDYDLILKERPNGTMPRIFDRPEGKRIYFQAWEWMSDGRTYTVHLCLVRESERRWETRHYETRYRAILRVELASVLRDAGFRDIIWHLPEESGYYQPIVTARKG